jgi:hypothetical protein
MPPSRVFPESRTVFVVNAQGEKRCSGDDRLDEPPSLPGLSPRASDLFVQVRARR